MSDQLFSILPNIPLPFGGILNAQHGGETGYPYELTAHCTKEPMGREIASHYVDGGVIVVTVKGEAEISSPETGQKEVVRPGDAYFVPPKINFDEKVLPKADWTTVFVIFTAKTYPSEMQKYLKERTLHFFKSNLKLAQKLTELSVCLEEKNGNVSLEATGLFLQVLGTTLDLLEGPDATASEFVNNVMTYLRKNLAKPLSVETMARAFKMSGSNFARRFRQEAGKTPIDALTHERVIMAKKLLLENKSVKETAGLLGFQNQFYLSKVFKKVEGLSPKAFQKNFFRR